MGIEQKESAPASVTAIFNQGTSTLISKELFSYGIGITIFLHTTTKSIPFSHSV